MYGRDVSPNSSDPRAWHFVEITFDLWALRLTVGIPYLALSVALLHRLTRESPPLRRWLMPFPFVHQIWPWIRTRAVPNAIHATSGPPKPVVLRKELR